MTQLFSRASSVQILVITRNSFRATRKQTKGCSRLSQKMNLIGYLIRTSSKKQTNYISYAAARLNQPSSLSTPKRNKMMTITMVATVALQSSDPLITSCLLEAPPPEYAGTAQPQRHPSSTALQMQ